MALQAMVACVVAGAAGLFLFFRWFSADIYDTVIVWMTARWYAVVFARLRPGDRVLDVGVGTATALARNGAALLEKRLSVVGIDYETAYVRKAEAVLRGAGLLRPPPEGTQGYRPGDFYCRVLQRSVYDEDLASLCRSSDAPGEPVPDAQRFDAAYFSGSLTVMPDPAAALRAVRPLVRREGRVFITQTFNKRRSPLMSGVKPLLKYITTIDFGHLTTHEDLLRIVETAGGFEVVEDAPIEGSLDTPWQTARLVVLRPRPTRGPGQGG